MRIITWNAQHGGGKRARGFAEKALSLNPDILVVTEFRNYQSGNIIQSVLNENGLCHQSLNDAPPRINSVLVASNVPFEQEQVPGLGAEDHRGVLAKFGDFDLFGFYFPGMARKKPIFDAICSLVLTDIHVASLMIGDFNTGRHFIDEKGATFIASEYFDTLEGLGWTDVWRSRNLDVSEYTWFSHVRNGFRLDHAFATNQFNNYVTDVRYIHSVREKRLSDHSAMVVDLTIAI